MSKRIKIYTDEQVPNSVIKGLRLRGINVLTTKEAKMLGAVDTAHLGFAQEMKRVILTQDDDFLRLHASGFDHCGIIYAHQRTPVGKIIRGIMLIHQILDSDDMKNHVEFLS